MGLGSFLAVREDRPGYFLDFRAVDFQDVGHAVDDGFQKADEHIQTVRAVAAGLLEPGGKGFERPGLEVAHGDQAGLGEDEGDGRGFHVVGIGAGDEVRRHEKGAVLLVKAARNLDLRHLRPAGNGNRKRFPDLLEFLRLGEHEVNPAGGQRLPEVFPIAELPHGVLAGEDLDHDNYRLHQFRLEFKLVNYNPCIKFYLYIKAHAVHF